MPQDLIVNDLSFHNDCKDIISINLKKMGFKNFDINLAKEEQDFNLYKVGIHEQLSPLITVSHIRYFKIERSIQV